MKVADILGGVPKECRGKYASHYRGVQEYSEMFPNLSQSELVDLTLKVSESPPGSVYRTKLIDYYSDLNYSKNNI